MKTAFPKNEDKRLAALKLLNLLDTPLEERFERISRMVCRSLKVPIAAVTLVDETRQWYKSIQGVNATESPRDGNFCAHTILKDEILLVPDALLDERFADHPSVTDAPFVRFYAGYPLSLSKDILVGTLCAVDTVPREMSPEDQESLFDLSKMVESELKAVAISQAQLELIQELNELERVAMLDSLTRVWNRFGIDKLLHREWSHALRNNSPLGIVMVDFDHFKKVNDTFGHLVGDEVIQGGARLMLSALRSYDVIGRWGGDEFMLILPGADREQCIMILQRIQEAITQNPVMTSRGEITISLSMGGVSVIPSTEGTSEDWVGKADNELMQVKRTGKGLFQLAD